MTEAREPDYDDISSIFFQDGYRLANDYLDGGTNRSAIQHLMIAAYEAMDGLIDSFRKRCEIEKIPVDCEKGCSFCCSQAVLASNHEILLIWQYLKDQISEDERKAFRSRVIQKNKKTRDMQAMQFLHYIHPCPFLDNGSCTIYPVRPMACRCYLSSSLPSCMQQYENPENRDMKAELFDFPLKAGRGMNEGIRSALMEKGLVPSEWLLESFMAAVFKDEALLDQWLIGEKLFYIRQLSPEENRYLKDYYTTDSEAS